MRAIVCVLLLVIAGASIDSAHAAGDAGLDRYRWSNRLVLLFAPKPDHPAIVEQKRILRHCGRGYRDRELKVLEIAGDGPVKLDGRVQRDLDAETLRRRFGIGPWEVRSLLIGKDGGVKLRSNGTMETDLLFATIDAMPMRQSELNDRAGRQIGCSY